MLRFADVELDVAVALTARSGTVLLSGQGCAPPTRPYVHEGAYDDVVDRLLAILAPRPVGDLLGPHAVVGSVVTEAAMEPILGAIARAKGDGVTLLVGGQRPGLTWRMVGSWRPRCAATSTTTTTGPATR
jgi:aldehyde dehydrogenase (NAD+)